MPVILTPTTLPVLTKDEIRAFLRDRADNNILLDQVQFTDNDINTAINLAVSEWNTITPTTDDGADTIPKAALILGTARWLMQSESFLQLRNQATYQDGEIGPIGLDDKFGAYAQLSSSLRSEWLELAQSYKIQKNMEASYGNLGSGYRWVPRTK
jgi:hypothetical protein